MMSRLLFRHVETKPCNAPAAYQPPSYVPPEAQRCGDGECGRGWLGLLGALVLGIVGISIAAAIFAPRIVKFATRKSSASTAT